MTVPGLLPLYTTGNLSNFVMQCTNKILGWFKFGNSTSINVTYRAGVILKNDYTLIIAPLLGKNRFNLICINIDGNLNFGWHFG